MMEKYMQEIEALRVIRGALYDALDVARECDDEESAAIYQDAMLAADRIRSRRIENIRTLPDAEDADLLFALYVEDTKPETIRKWYKWSTSEYKRRLRKALTAYKEKLRV